jgi:hypothetical protein
VQREVLENGDILLIGKHTLVYDASDGVSVADAPAPDEDARSKVGGGTVFLDTKQQSELLAKMGIDPSAETIKLPQGSAGLVEARKPVRTRVGLLRALAGKSDQGEYELNQATSIIGSADTASVKLKGWFKPKSAVAIARKGGAYTVTRSAEDSRSTTNRSQSP